jgi:peptide-methionine (S)-S-oxide reductase
VRAGARCISALAAVLTLIGCGGRDDAAAQSRDATSAPQAAARTDGLAEATFAGGCFWCMEPPYDELDGVRETISGYTGGRTPNPTYEQVSAGGTGHVEVVRVVYDPAVVSYETLVSVFWKNIDPFARNRQFCDSGDQYRSAIFYHDSAQRRVADSTKRAHEQRFGREIATQIVPAAAFTAAEEYHQDYYTKNPVRYKFYRWNCGRDARLREVWGE